MCVNLSKESYLLSLRINSRKSMSSTSISSCITWGCVKVLLLHLLSIERILKCDRELDCHGCWGKYLNKKMLQCWREKQKDKISPLVVERPKGRYEWEFLWLTLWWEKFAIFLKKFNELCRHSAFWRISQTKKKTSLGKIINDTLLLWNFGSYVWDNN